MSVVESILANLEWNLKNNVKEAHVGLEIQLTCANEGLSLWDAERRRYHEIMVWLESV